MPSKQKVKTTTPGAGPSIDLGRLQAELTAASRAAKAADRALQKAQEVRDQAKTGLDRAEVALREAARTVLG